MTNAQSYSIKEMLEKMSEERKEERAETNKKIDGIHKDIKDFRAESNIADETQDKRIGVLENWKSFIMGAVWLLSGSGAITGIYFLITFISSK